MKKFAVALAFAAALSTGVAFADTMQNAYVNTIVVTYASGAEARYFFNEDGSFTGVAPGGSTMRGTYTVEGDQLCLIPPTGGAHTPTCTQIALDKSVGDTWTQTGTSGEEVTVTLQAGR